MQLMHIKNLYRSIQGMHILIIILEISIMIGKIMMKLLNVIKKQLNIDQIMFWQWLIWEFAT